MPSFFKQPSLVPHSETLDDSQAVRLVTPFFEQPSLELRSSTLGTSRLAHASDEVVVSIHFTRPSLIPSSGTMASSAHASDHEVVDSTSEFQRPGSLLKWWGILAISVAAAVVIIAAIVVVLCKTGRIHVLESESSTSVETFNAGRIKTVELTNDWSSERTETAAPPTWDDY